MEDLNREESMGVVIISDEVVSVIAGIAAQEIEGVLDTQTGVASNITSILKKGKKNAGKGTKVTINGDKATIDMSIVVEYGRKIMDLAAQVQENVKKTVEAMTGLAVESVNVSVQNIYEPKTEESETK